MAVSGEMIKQTQKSLGQFVKKPLTQELLDMTRHHHLQLPDVRDEVAPGVRLGHALVELLGLSLQARDDDEGGDQQDHRPHEVEHHWDAP